MPKITKCLKCLKLRYSIDFIQIGSQGVQIYSFAKYRFSRQESSMDKKKGLSVAKP